MILDQEKKGEEMNSFSYQFRLAKAFFCDELYELCGAESTVSIGYSIGYASDDCRNSTSDGWILKESQVSLRGYDWLWLSVLS